MTAEEQEILDREKVAAAMIRCSLATGHGDTIDDLLAEMEAQVIQLIQRCRLAN